LNRKQKKELVESLHKTFLNSQSIIVTHLNGLTVSETTNLRSNMRNANCKFKVTKNKIVKLALKETKFEHLDSLFTGPTAIGSSEDAIAPAKVLVNFTKETDKLKIIGGGVETKSLSVNEITNLASLPSLDEVRSKLIGLLMAGPTKLVRIIKEPSSRLARILATKNN
jgi:large subunit ribosomal protein L10